MNGHGPKRNRFRRLWGDLLLFLLLTTLSAAWIIHMVHRTAQTTRELQSGEAAYRKIISQVDQIRGDELPLRKSIDRFKQLHQQGVLGQEQRLEWVEQLQQIQQQRRLHDLGYKLAPQRMLQEQSPPASGTRYQAWVSSMKLKMPLLHEDDLIQLVSDLNIQQSAILRVRRCTLERIQEPAQEQRLSPRLQADCDLDWITLKDKKS